jgi:hypothetical protein
MANVYATKNGNWSDTTVWNTGSLPTASDDVFANNFTVTINQNINVLSIRTTSDTGINAGGRFDLNSGFNVNADIRAGGTGSSQACLYITFNSPSTATITGNIFGSSATPSDIHAVWHVGSGAVTINGAVNSGSGTSGARRYGIYNQSIASITINGDVYANTTGNGASNFNGVVNQSTGSIILNGNAYGSTTVDNRAVYLVGGGSYTQVGNVIGTLATGNAVSEVILILSASVNITGNLDSGLNGGAVLLQGTGAFTITGTLTNRATGNNFGNALRTTGTLSGTINGDLIGSSTGTGGNNSAFFHQSTGLLTINGNLIRQGAGGNAIWQGITGSNVVVNGNLIGAVGSSAGAVIRHQSANSFLTINGNVNAMGTSGSAITFDSSNGSTIIINGNVAGGSGINPTIQQTSGGFVSFFITVNGTVTAGTAQPAVDIRSGTLTARRVVGNGFGIGSTGVTQVFAVAVTSPAILVVQEVEFGSLGATPISPYCRLQLTANSVVVFRDISGNPVTLVNPTGIANYPSISDVRKGAIYASGNLSGTLEVPSFNNVAFNVPVDSGVGTAILRPQDVWDYMRINITGSGTIGERLKNAATIQSVGDQIAAF